MWTGNWAYIVYSLFECNQKVALIFLWYLTKDEWMYINNKNVTKLVSRCWSSFGILTHHESVFHKINLFCKIISHCQIWNLIIVAILLVSAASLSSETQIKYSSFFLRNKCNTFRTHVTLTFLLCSKMSLLILGEYTECTARVESCAQLWNGLSSKTIILFRVAAQTTNNNREQL